MPHRFVAAGWEPVAFSGPANSVCHYGSSVLLVLRRAHSTGNLVSVRHPRPQACCRSSAFLPSAIHAVGPRRGDKATAHAWGQGKGAAERILSRPLGQGSSRCTANTAVRTNTEIGLFSSPPNSCGPQRGWNQSHSTLERGEGACRPERRTACPAPPAGAPTRLWVAPRAGSLAWRRLSRPGLNRMQRQVCGRLAGPALPQRPSVAAEFVALTHLHAGPALVQTKQCASVMPQGAGCLEVRKRLTFSDASTQVPTPHGGAHGAPRAATHAGAPAELG